MEQHLYELLRQCTVWVSIPGKTGHGTGFFVAPGLILTCAHVLSPTQSDTPPLEAYWKGQAYHAQIMKLQQDSDLALLQVTLTDHPCVYLHEEAIPFDSLYSYGYPDDRHAGDPATFVLEGKAGEQGEQLKFKTGQVRPGMSGAPLLNVRTGHVCGVVQLTRDRNNDLGGRAIPTTTVLRVFPELVAQQQHFHQHDRQWTNCLWETVARTKYLEGMIRRYSSVTLPIGPAQRFSLQAIFQPLKLRRDPLAAEDLASEERRVLLGELRNSNAGPRRALSEPVGRGSSNQGQQASAVVIAENADDALKKSSKRSIVVLGGPGTGKTTLLKYLVGDQAQKALADPQAQLPIFISLTALARSGKTLKEYLISIVQDMMVDERYAQVLWKALERGQTLVCLDGLDEVEPKLRHDKIGLINDWAAGTNSAYIVGSRFTDYKGGLLRSEQFTEWELQPMTPPLRHELAKRLLPELYQWMSPGDAPAERNISAFVNMLEKHEQAAAWGENPLLFSLAAVVFVLLGTLPSSRVVLYQQVTDAVLEMREPDRTRRGLLRDVVACLALEFFQEKGRTFTHNDLLHLLRIVRKRQDEQWNTEEMVHRIIDSGILEVVAHDTYGFRHQTFQEYLAAVELAQRLVSRDQAAQVEGWDLAWSKRTYSRWTEVLRLMVGVLILEYKGEGAQRALYWLRELVQQRKKVDGDLGDLGLILAVKSLSEVPESSPTWQRIEGGHFAEELVTTWAQELRDAIQYQRKAKEERLHALAGDVGRLRASDMKIAIAPLTQMLSVTDLQKRITVLRVLGHLGKGTPVQLLVEAIRDRNERVRAAAAEALGQLREQAPAEPLVRALSDTDDSVRIAAARALGHLGERAPMEPLVQALEDKHDYVREAAAEALGRLGVRALHALEMALCDEHSYHPMGLGSTAGTAAKALAQLGERGIKVLEQALDDWEPSVRAFAVEALGQLEEQAPVDLLIRALSDGHPWVREAAVRAVGWHKDQAPVELIIKALDDSDRDVRYSAVYALGWLRERAPIELLGKVLREGNSSMRMAAASVLGWGWFGPRAPVEPLVQALNDEDKSVRTTAAETLGKLGERAPVEPLVQALRDEEDPWVREKLAMALGQLGERAPPEPLVQALRDDRTPQFAGSPSITAAHKAAVEALGQLGKRAPIEPLVQALIESETDVRKAAARVLGRLGQSVVEQHMQIQYDNSPEMRVVAIETLGERGRQAPVEPFIQALEDGHPRVRAAAARELWQLEDRAPIHMLVQALNDSHYEVREAAARTLGLLGKRTPVKPLVQALYEIGDPAADALLQLGSRGTKALLASLRRSDPIAAEIMEQRMGKPRNRIQVKLLVQALQKGNPQMRATAAEALGQLGERAPVEPLVQALRTERHPKVCEKVAEALGQLGERAPIEPLVEVLCEPFSMFDSEELKKAAAQALANLGERGIKPLIQALDDDAPRRRRLVVEALGKLGTKMPKEPLMRVLHDENEYVRIAAAAALGQVGEQQALNMLKQVLEDNDLSLRKAALEALKTFRGQASVDLLLQALHDTDASIRQEAVQALGQLGERAPVESLIWALGESTTRLAAVQALGQLGERVPIEPLVQALDDGDPSVRRAALQALGQLGERVPIESLIWALGESTTRLAAVQALGQLGERVPIEPLVQALGAWDPSVRWEASRILRRMYPDALLEVAHEAEAILRGRGSGQVLGSLTQIFIAYFIGEMERVPPDLLEKLTHLLYWPYWEVRMYAAQALGKLRRSIPDAAILRLLELRHDPQSRAVREASEDALAEILSLETGIEDD